MSSSADEVGRCKIPMQPMQYPCMQDTHAIVTLAFREKVEAASAHLRTEVLCESRGGRHGIPVPSSPYGLCGRKATLNLNCSSSILAGYPD